MKNLTLGVSILKILSKSKQNFRANNIPSNIGQLAPQLNHSLEDDTTGNELALNSQTFNPKESVVPSTKASRLFHYGLLGAKIAMNATSKTFSGNKSPLMYDERNIENMVSTFTRMRGAAMKLGQMLSIQDSLSNDVIPPQIQEILMRVQNQADVMPRWQLEKTMRTNLGNNWLEKFKSFDFVPIAAASIGQVHKAVIELDGKSINVAVKVQYPGVAKSIQSDLSYLAVIVKMGGLLPKGLFLDNTIKVAKKDLEYEVDYVREANNYEKFASLIFNHKSLSKNFVVPKVFRNFSSKEVLVTEFQNGIPLSKVDFLNQVVRDKIGENMLRLCLSELFEFKQMQTDPNWSNFLYQHETKKIVLLDFGASMTFPKTFTDDYLQLLIASSNKNDNDILHYSRRLGFLTGDESGAMNNAHIIAIQSLSGPFSNKGIFDFGQSTEVTSTVKNAIPTMLELRLKPPPDESYSLHRKLSGAFLLCS